MQCDFYIKKSRRKNPLSAIPPITGNVCEFFCETL